ncbi:hypothetical protein GCM10009692_18760 [Leucobacter aridicollis]
MTAIAVIEELPQVIAGVSDGDLRVIQKLAVTWRAKLTRNQLRSVYYDGKMPLKPTGNIPAEAMQRIRAVLGWPAKSVQALAQRTVFDGFVTPSTDQDPFELGSLLEANSFDLEFPQAVVSAFKHSCAFITTTRGDVQSGDPEVVIQARSAEWSAALWDKRRRRVSAYMGVTGITEGGLLESFDVYLPERVLKCSRDNRGRWSAEVIPNLLGEVAAEPLTYDPQLDRPFGRSRISRAVMTITDHALSTIVRSEIASDFYAAPRMAALGVAEDAFSNGKWEAAIDRWFALTKDEDGDTPTVQQFPQMTMQPLLDQYRMYASQFAGETGLPVSSLGIVQDNPPSAEALYAAEKDLIVEARACTRVMGVALRQVAKRSVMIRDGLTEAPKELAGIRANWLNPAFTSPITAAAALMNLSQVFPWIGETEVALEYAGFTSAEITRLQADKRRLGAGSVLEQLVAGETPTSDVSSGEAPASTQSSELAEAQVLKARADALGILRRAGVDEHDAAARVGLDGLKFIPGNPITIRERE